MRLRVFSLSSLGLYLLTALILFTDRPSSRVSVPVGAANPQVLANYGKLPLSFEANQGQTDEQVKFLSRGKGYTLFLTSTEAVLALRKTAEKGEGTTSVALSPDGAARFSAAHNARLKAASTGETDPSAAPYEQTVVRMKLLGANPEAHVTGVEKLPGKSNYFIGNNPEKWRTNVPHYGKVRYEEVYPGIDLVYYGSDQQQLEYDFIVSPGADPKAIRLGFEDADRLSLDQEGNLLLDTKGGEVVFNAPTIYQEIGGTRKPIAGRYISDGKHQVGFKIAAYDPSKPLIIDPVLVYSTYLGGTGDDWGTGIAVDPSGSVYVTGSTHSKNFPTVKPFQTRLRKKIRLGRLLGQDISGNSDAFIAKLSPDGTELVYATYFGGKDDDFGFAIAVDAGGNAYVTGSTTSKDFPTANAFQPECSDCGSRSHSDAFIAKLSPDGTTLEYSTYLGGRRGDETGRGIAVHSSGAIYITGSTNSKEFPTANPIQPNYAGPSVFLGNNVFVTKLNHDGSTLVYSTYLGGGGYDVGRAIAVDSAGNAYLTGETGSKKFPMVNPFQGTHGGVWDAFVAKLNADGSALLYSTYLGGSGGDLGFGIAVDAGGSAFITGRTKSKNFPTASPFQASKSGGHDAFVTKLNPEGSELVYSSYFGGKKDDGGFGIAVDADGNAYVTGETKSKDFPTGSPLEVNPAGKEDVFVIKVNPDGTELVYSSYLGGKKSDTGLGIAVDADSSVYVIGWTRSKDFPIANALQAECGNCPDGDAFVTKLNIDDNPP